MIIYGFATKFGIRMHPYPEFQCTKFQGNRIMPLCISTPWRKEEERKKRRKKKLIQIMKAHILETPGVI